MADLGKGDKTIVFQSSPKPPDADGYIIGQEWVSDFGAFLTHFKLPSSRADYERIIRTAKRSGSDNRDKARIAYEMASARTHKLNLERGGPDDPGHAYDHGLPYAWRVMRKSDKKQVGVVFRDPILGENCYVVETMPPEGATDGFTLDAADNINDALIALARHLGL